MSDYTRRIVAHRIPLDLIPEILGLLPAKSILRFKCVCKEWYNLINSPFFIKLHLGKSLELNSQHNCILYWNTSILCVVDDIYDHPVKVTKLNWPVTIRDGDRIYHVGSCNGLVCFKVTRRSTSNRIIMPYTIRCFLICNPTTRTFKSIYPPQEEIWGARSSSYGFGSDSEHDDYKIVVTRCLLIGDDKGQVFIYSLKSNSWSSPSPLTRILTGGGRSYIRGVTFGHNMIHYLVYHVLEGIPNHYRIARLDVAYEKWTDDLSLPVQEKSFVRIGNLDGRLYVDVLDHDLRSSDVWILKEDGSWKKMFNLCQDLYENYQLLKDHVLKWYEQRDNTRMPLKLAPRPEGGSAILLCIASLIRIPGCSLIKLQVNKE